MGSIGTQLENTERQYKQSLVESGREPRDEYEELLLNDQQIKPPDIQEESKQEEVSPLRNKNMAQLSNDIDKAETVQDLYLIRREIQNRLEAEKNQKRRNELNKLLNSIQRAEKELYKQGW